jgi:hypothetical protein
MSQLLKNLNSEIDTNEQLVKEYLSSAFLLDENNELIQESFDAFLKAAYSIINDEPAKITDDIIKARENLAKILVGLLQWKSGGVRGKDHALYRKIQARLTNDHLDSAKELGAADKNQKLLKLIIADMSDDKQKVKRIVDDLRAYYSKDGILKKSSYVLDISSS